MMREKGAKVLHLGVKQGIKFVTPYRLLGKNRFYRILFEYIPLEFYLF